MKTVTKTRKPAKTARVAKAIKPTKTEKKVTFSKWDPAEIITTKGRVIAFLEEGAYPVFCVNENRHFPPLFHLHKISCMPTWKTAKNLNF